MLARNLEAADVIWATNSSESLRTVHRRAEMAPDRYERWLADTGVASCCQMQAKVVAGEVAGTDQRLAEAPAPGRG